MSRRIIGVRRGDSVQERIREPVQNLTELRLVPTNDVNDKALIVTEDSGGLYRFDYDGVGADDGSTIIAPINGPGRWFLMNSSTGGVDNEAFRASFPVIGDSIIQQIDWPVENVTVVDVQVLVDPQPTTAGVYELRITGNGNNLLQAAFIDLTALAAGGPPTSFPLTATAGDLDLTALDLIDIEITSDNADLLGESVEVAIVHQTSAAAAAASSGPDVEKTVLTPLQLVPSGVLRATMLLFDPVALINVPADGETFDITDGTTSETYTFRNVPAVPFDVSIGADVLDTLDGIEATINADSARWIAERVTDMDRFHINAPAKGHGVVIARDTLAGSDTDRIFASVAVAANLKVANFQNEINYSDSESALTPPVSDPGSGNFFGYSESFPKNGSLRVSLSDPELYSFQRRLPDTNSVWTLIGPISGGGGGSDLETFTSAEAHVIGQVLASSTSGDTVKADRTTAEYNIVGISTQVVGAAASVDVFVTHGKKVPVLFSAAPLATDNGKTAWLNSVSGEASTTPPTLGSGDAIIEIGTIVGANGALTLVDIVLSPDHKGFA